MLSVHEASARIMRGVTALPPERVPLLDALGLVLAEAVEAPITVPPWDNSAMDGYAVRAVDIGGASAEAPIALTVTETVAAGGFAAGEVSPGTAVRIMTGAPIPAGADTVVRVEDTDGGTSIVHIRDGRDASRNVRARGEDFHAGEQLIEAGTALGPAQIGVLASIGAATVPVHRRPRVAILGSGDELVDLDRFDEVRAGRKIASSNNYTLHAMIRAAGGVPINLGISRDDPADLRRHLERAARSDLLVTSAGVSVGEFDYTRDVLAELGAEMDFWKVRMRPGAPLGFGSLHAMPWIGLPGNPVSTMVTFELFVRPVILRMLGHLRCFRRPVSVVVEEPVRIGARLVHFLRATVSARPDGTLGARLTGPQGSGILTSMIRANALLVVPLERAELAPGDTATAIPLGDAPAHDATFAV
jgi:molybdopterin molybdotransferase